MDHQVQILDRELPFKSAMPNQFLNGWHLSFPDESNFVSCFFWIGLREANTVGDFLSAFSCDTHKRTGTAWSAGALF